jgi:hypothetical protein
MIWVVGIDDDACLGINPTPKTKAVFTVEHIALGFSVYKDCGQMCGARWCGHDASIESN